MVGWYGYGGRHMTWIEDVIVGNLFDYGRLLIVGIFAYLALVIILRISGKRTLAAMNIFDFIVTVALGSTLASVITSATVSLLEGILALFILVGLQYVVTWSSVRFNLVERMVKSEPRLLYYEGELLRDAMKAERITEAEIKQALRAQGSLAGVHAIVLETNGNLSVLPATDRGNVTSLSNVVGYRALGREMRLIVPEIENVAEKSGAQGRNADSRTFRTMTWRFCRSPIFYRIDR